MFGAGAVQPRQRMLSAMPTRIVKWHPGVALMATRAPLARNRETTRSAHTETSGQPEMSKRQQLKQVCWKLKLVYLIGGNT